MSSAVPEGWSENTINECCEILDSQRIPLNAEERAKRKGDYPYYGANGVQGYIDDYIFDGDAILLAEDGGNFDQYAERPIAQWVTGRFWVNNHAHILRAKSGLTDKWVYYSLVHKNILKYINGGTRAKLNQSDLKEIAILLSPLPEQKKIASILTSVDEVIENTQKQIDKLQDLKKATMNELLTKGIGHTEFKNSELGRIPEGWIIAEFGDYFLKLSSGMTPSRSKPEYFNGNIPWVTSGELDYNIITSTRENISEQAVKDTNLKVYPPGTIFIAITGLEAAGTRGRCAILGVSSTVNQSCMAFPVNPDIDSTFFFQNYLLRGEQYAFKYSQGTKQQSFNAEIVKKLPILIPPLSEQKKIASILTSMDKNIKEKQNKLSQTQSLKKSLMQDLLTGKVRVSVN